MQTHEIMRRKEERLPVSLGARLRTARGSAADGVLTNLSASGCALRIDASFLEPGSLVAVKMEGLEGVGGIVRWKHGSFMGVEFQSPLYPAIVEHLSKTTRVRVTATS